MREPEPRLEAALRERIRTDRRTAPAGVPARRVVRVTDCGKPVTDPDGNW